MTRLRPIFLLLLLFVPLTPSLAVEVSGLYQVEVPVPDQSAASRADALKTALQAVLVKVTGYQVGDDPAFADMLKDPSHYVQQYRYRNEAGPAVPTPDGTAAPSQQLVLWVRFGRRALNQALRRMDQPIWGEARPLTVVWLAVQRGDSRRKLIGSSDDDPLKDALKDEAHQRGIPLRLPLLDLSERSQVSVADVWGGFYGELKSLSKRYQPQAVLAGRVYGNTGNWHADWTLEVGNDTVHWSGTGATAEEVVRSGVDSTADALSQRFAQTQDDTGGSGLDLQVTGVQDMADYGRVVDYLHTVNGVVQVQVQGVSPSAVTLHLMLDANSDSVANSIALGNTLQAVGSVSGDAGPVTYRLVP